MHSSHNINTKAVSKTSKISSVFLDNFSYKKSLTLYITNRETGGKRIIIGFRFGFRFRFDWRRDILTITLKWNRRLIELKIKKNCIWNVPGQKRWKRRFLREGMIWIENNKKGENSVFWQNKMAQICEIQEGLYP